mmetsp:Transcript_38410/g.59941  ORF Transcript_38410/g.59941 Transcript_38410/m.59941 type:complete len:217 (+) Transcript_38410:767-1417(+)
MKDEHAIAIPSPMASVAPLPRTVGDSGRLRPPDGDSEPEPTLIAALLRGDDAPPARGDRGGVVLKLANILSVWTLSSNTDPCRPWDPSLKIFGTDWESPPRVCSLACCAADSPSNSSSEKSNSCFAASAADIKISPQDPCAFEFLPPVGKTERLSSLSVVSKDEWRYILAVMEWACASLCTFWSAKVLCLASRLWLPSILDCGPCCLAEPDPTGAF